MRAAAAPLERPPYDGPRLILVRFGGGVRRRETIAAGSNSYCPYLLQERAPQGTLFSAMQIDTAAPDTGHGQGTLNLLTGTYARYKDVSQQFLGERFEAQSPTLFEYLRQAFEVAPHQALIVNGEDRTQEEFYSFSNHHLFGVEYRSEVLSLYRFKTHLLHRRLQDDRSLPETERDELNRRLAKMESLDYRRADAPSNAAIAKFWDRWRARYGDSGLTCPRGDRLLTELAVTALRELRPKLMMINYNDCDYVHWGNLTHYTQGIAVMDAGLQRLVEAVEGEPEYRDRTVFVVVPDCGRDDSKFSAIPCQHHFNSRSSREIFALLWGPGIERGRVVDRTVEQNQVAATVAAIMGFAAPHAEGAALAEALS
jgi:hypothetical protein